MLTVESFRAALGDYQPHLLPDVEGQTRAAVAAMLRPGEGGAEFLFIHRAEDPRDPWSGHMAFPGGRVDSGDTDPLAAAVRETREEVGLDLESIAERIGRLSDVAAIGRGRPMNMVINPYVFAAESVPAMTPNYEVAEVVWVPASFLADHRNRESMDYQRGGLSLELPCDRDQDHLNSQKANHLEKFGISMNYRQDLSVYNFDTLFFWAEISIYKDCNLNV